MKIVIIGAGSAAFTPALLSGFGIDTRYQDAVIGLVDIDTEALTLVEKTAKRFSEELGLNWTVLVSTERRDILPGADIVTAAVGVGGLKAWIQDVEIPYKHGFIQPVGDTCGPGGLARGLRHIPVLVGIAQDMEELCPEATLYNFTNPLTVLTQAVSKRTKIKCIGLCIGVDLTWDHLCRVVGVEKSRTAIVAGGINHCHWILDFRIDGQPGFPILSAALDELDGSPEKMEQFRQLYETLGKRPQEPRNKQPLCTTLYRRLGYYPGPGDGHVIEFFPQFIQAMLPELGGDTFQGQAIRYVKKSYPELWEKLRAIAENRTTINTETFAKELAWEHTQLLDILVAQQDDLEQTFFINIPNRGCITNLPPDAVVEIPATVDAGGIHPFALGNLPESILPTLAQKIATLDLTIEAALEGSREKAVQVMINDPYCTNISKAAAMVNELIDTQLEYLPNFQ